MYFKTAYICAKGRTRVRSQMRGLARWLKRSVRLERFFARESKNSRLRIAPEYTTFSKKQHQQQPWWGWKNEPYFYLNEFINHLLLAKRVLKLVKPFSNHCLDIKGLKRTKKGSTCRADSFLADVFLCGTIFHLPVLRLRLCTCLNPQPEPICHPLLPNCATHCHDYHMVICQIIRCQLRYQ